MIDGLRTRRGWRAAKSSFPRWALKAKPHLHRMMLFHRFRKADHSKVVIEVGGARISLDRSNLHDYRQWEMFAKGPHPYEAGVVRILESYLRPGDTFVDVGANNGYLTVVAAKKVGPTGKVLAFEPSPRSRPRLMANVSLNGLFNVEIYPFALSDRVSTALLSTGAMEDGWDRLSPGNGVGPHQTVPTTRLDAVPGAGTVHGFKIDVEGHEAAVLAGMQRSLSERAFGVVEWDPKQRRALEPALERFDCFEITDHPARIGPRLDARGFARLGFVNLLVLRGGAAT